LQALNRYSSGFSLSKDTDGLILAIAAIIKSYHYFKTFSFSNDGIAHILAVVVKFTSIVVLFLSQMMQLPLF